MAHKIREDDPETMHANNEEHDGDQLNAVYLNSYFKPLEPLKPVQSPATDERSKVPHTLRLRLQILAVMAVACAGGLVTALDAVVVATALPSIAKDLSATTSEIALIGASYLLGSVLLQPVWPNLSKRIGRKWTLTLGFILFTAGSLIASLARQASVLIAGRTVQGLGAGNLSLMCIDIIVYSFKSRRVHGVGITLGTVLGPVMSGLLTTYLAWRWCFYVDLIIAGLALAVLVILVDLPRSSRNANSPNLGVTDWLRPAMVITTIIPLLIGLQLGGLTLSWGSTIFIGLMLAGCIAGTIFVVQRSFHPQSELPPWIADIRSLTACLSVSFLHGFTYMGCLYYLPMYFQLVLGASPVQSGLLSNLAIILMLYTRGITRFAIIWAGYHRPVIWVSASCLTLGIGLSIALPSHWNYPLVVIILLRIAAGTRPLLHAPLFVLDDHVPHQERSGAKAALVFMATLGSAIGLVIGQVVLRNELITRLASSADMTQDPVTVLADLSSFPLEKQEILHRISPLEVLFGFGERASPFGTSYW